MINVTEIENKLNEQIELYDSRTSGALSKSDVYTINLFRNEGVNNHIRIVLIKTTTFYWDYNTHNIDPNCNNPHKVVKTFRLPLPADIVAKINYSNGIVVSHAGEQDGRVRFNFIPTFADCELDYFDDEDYKTIKGGYYRWRDYNEKSVLNATRHNCFFTVNAVETLYKTTNNRGFKFHASYHEALNNTLGYYVNKKELGIFDSMEDAQAECERILK